MASLSTPVAPVIDTAAALSADMGDSIDGGGTPVEVLPKRSISMRESLSSGWYATPRLAFYGREVLLGIIICMAQIPESIAFAYLARVRPPVALHAAWVVGLVCALLGGRPGMINGATGAFAAIVSSFLEEPLTPGGNGKGVELLFPSVIVGGVLMLVVWALRLDKFISMLPLPVMIGFCNGLAIVIGLAQLHPFYAPVCPLHTATGHANMSSTAGVSSATRRRELATGACTSTGFKQGAELWWMLLIMTSAMLIMEFLPKLPKPTKISKRPAWAKPFLLLLAGVLELPSSLISIVASILLEFFLIRPLGFRTDTIGDKEKFTSADAWPRLFFLEGAYDLSLISAEGAAARIAQQGLLLCAVGCIESLMTAEVVSQFTKTPHHSGLVVGAMGVGNIISGFLGGMGGNAMIGLSTIACLNGGKGRIAPLTTAVGIITCVAAAYQVLNFIPMAALAGVMIVVVLHTFKWFSVPMLAAALLPSSYRTALSDRASAASESLCSACGSFNMHRKVVRSDVLVMLTVSCLVVLTNIVLAVGIGLGLSCAAYAWESAQRVRVYSHIVHEADSVHGEASRGGAGMKGDPDGGAGADGGIKVYRVDGPLFFAGARRFTESFAPESDPAKSVVLFSAGYIFDSTLTDALVGVSAAYQAQGKSIEFRQLEARACDRLSKDAYHTKLVHYSPADALPGLRAGRGYRLPELSRDGPEDALAA